MCCLYGIIDCNHVLSVKQKNRLISALATAAEVRGTDATGIAYNSGGKLRIYKRPIPAHFMRFHIPEDAGIITGHTRMTTQGSACKNRNNHPFSGYVDHQPFALAHNGVIYNDDDLRRQWSLPTPKIETDSFVAVQLIEKKKSLSPSSLKFMAEQLRGSFTITVLDGSDTLSIIKGDNPLCLYHYPRAGIYVYASTKEILNRALKRCPIPVGKSVSVDIADGDILQIGADGTISRSSFDKTHLLHGLSSPFWGCCEYEDYQMPVYVRRKERSYLDELKSVAMSFGYTPENIDHLASQGFAPEEIEEFLYGFGEV